MYVPVITYQTIPDIVGIDIDDFVRASLPYMDTDTYSWPPGCTTEAAKLAVIHDIIASYAAFPNGLIYTMTVDGRVVAVNFGRVINDTLRGLMVLVRPDANGSRAFYYSTEALTALVQFVKSQGLQYLEGVQIPNSRMREPFKGLGITDADYKRVEIYPSGEADIFRYKVE